MSCIEPATNGSTDQHGPETVMQCTEDSDDLECYYKRLHYASTDSRHKMFPSSGPPTHQANDANQSSESLLNERQLLKKEGAESQRVAQHTQGLFSREEFDCYSRMETCSVSSEFTRHNRMPVSSVLSTSSKALSSFHHFFWRNTGYQEQGSSNTSEESFECNNDSKKENKHFSGQVAASVKCDPVLDSTNPNIPLPRASKASCSSHSDSYEDDFGRSTRAKQHKAHYHTKKNKPTAGTSKEPKNRHCHFEMDNLLFQPPKKESSLSSSSTSDSNLEEYLQQNHPTSSTGTSERDHYYFSIPQIQSYLSCYSGDESNLDDSKSSFGSYKENNTISNTLASSHSRNTSAVFCCGVRPINTIWNSGTRGLNKERSNCKPNAYDELRHPARDTKHPQSAKQTSSGHLSYQSANQEMLDLNSALTESSKDSQSVQCSFWQRGNHDPFSNNQQITVRRQSPVTQAEKLEENSDFCDCRSINCDYRRDRKESYPDKVHLIKETHPDTATSYRVNKPRVTPDVIESFSSHSLSSGYDNGSSEEELRGRCIAPGCFNEIMHAQSSLCIGCYSFLQRSNNQSSEYHASLFAADRRLCKGPNCHSPGSASQKGLCESCCRTLSMFVMSNTDKMVACTVSNPLKIKPHIRRDPKMPWRTFFNTPLDKI